MAYSEVNISQAEPDRCVTRQFLCLNVFYEHRPDSFLTHMHWRDDDDQDRTFTAKWAGPMFKADVMDALAQPRMVRITTDEDGFVTAFRYAAETLAEQ